MPSIIAVLALPALAGAQPGAPPVGPSLDVGAVPNGDLSAGLEGWGAWGPGLSLVGGPLVQASDNTTVLTPPVALAPGAQVMPIVLGVPGANAVVDIRARPVEGGADIPLATIVPDRAVRAWSIGVGAVRGRTVRIVIDPVTSLGRRMYVRSVGPVREVLPGWEVSAGAPAVQSAWGRRAVVARDGALVLRTPLVALPPGTRFLGLAVRGAGTVRATAGRRGARAVATTGRWTAIRVPVPVGSGARMAVTATPADGQRLALWGVGTPVRVARLSRVSASASGLVRARTGAFAAGARVEVRLGSRVVGRGVVGADGAIAVRASGSGPARLVLLDDAAVIGSSARVVLPG